MLKQFRLTFLRLDICENGIKHAAWEMAPARADAGFFARHTVSELLTWSDYELEKVGRLAEPMRWILGGQITINF